MWDEEGSVSELLTAKNISKYFPGVKALENVSITIRSGEVLGVLGENGAGKSTLLNILSGIYKPDGGEVIIGGEPVQILSVKHAFELGIAIVHQELMLHNNLSVAENVYMGRLPVNKFGKVQYNQIYKKTDGLMKTYHFDIDSRQLVGDLSIAERQMVEITKALSYDAKVILMDEPTSSLTSEETQRLFETMETLKKKDVGIVFISHKLEEIKICCDRVQVLRDGTDLGERFVKDTTEDELVKLMVGREISQRFPAKTNVPGEVVLEVHGLSRGKAVKNVSFSVRKGEVFGMAGLVGSGRSEIVRLLFGADKKDKGEISVKGKKVNIRSPKDAIKNGIFLVPEDRKKQGLVLNQPVQFNIVLASIDVMRKLLGYIDRKKEKTFADTQIQQFNVKCSGRDQVAVTLSGGNQQKVVIAKCVLTEPDIMILDDPTRGIDVGAKSEIYELINDLTSNGKSVILISSELPEVIKMSDRVAVISNGSLRTILEKDEMTQERIIKYAIGGD
jgi:ribose transport system ATP-binding protein